MQDLAQVLQTVMNGQEVLGRDSIKNPMERRVHLIWWGRIWGLGGIMSRVFALAKAIGSVLAIETFVPGGTLILLAILLTSRPGSPLLALIERRFPPVSRILRRLARVHVPQVAASAHD